MQIEEAELSPRLLGIDKDLAAHCKAAALGCHWHILAGSSSSESGSSAVAPAQSATRSPSPTRQETDRTSKEAPMPRRSRRPSAERLASATPSARSRSPLVPGDPPCRAILRVSAAALQASWPRRTSISASLTFTLEAFARLSLALASAFSSCASSWSTSSCNVAKAPRTVNGSWRKSRWSSLQASMSCSARASTARQADSSLSKPALASARSPRTLSGCTRSANLLYALLASAAFSGPLADMPSTAKASGARKRRAAASSEGA
mmetsp:Transcript_41357/g.90245  ORF Transcript_41357/g.90245 Transcript_41357/m.90245 type:complete len:264 (+) Transcript_41357:281-1072(+)